MRTDPRTERGNEAADDVWHSALQSALEFDRVILTKRMTYTDTDFSILVQATGQETSEFFDSSCAAQQHAACTKTTVGPDLEDRRDSQYIRESLYPCRDPSTPNGISQILDQGVSASRRNHVIDSRQGRFGIETRLRTFRSEDRKQTLSE